MAALAVGGMQYWCCHMISSCIFYFVFCISYFVFRIPYFVFHILYFVFRILYFVFRISYFVVFFISYFVFCSFSYLYLWLASLTVGGMQYWCCYMISYFTTQYVHQCNFLCIFSFLCISAFRCIACVLHIIYMLPYMVEIFSCHPNQLWMVNFMCQKIAFSRLVSFYVFDSRNCCCISTHFRFVFEFLTSLWFVFVFLYIWDLYLYFYML